MKFLCAPGIETARKYGNRISGVLSVIAFSPPHIRTNFVCED